MQEKIIKNSTVTSTGSKVYTVGPAKTKREWTINKQNGTLIIHKNFVGNWPDVPPWLSQAEHIRAVVIEKGAKTKTCKNMFMDCSELQQISLKNLDISEATDFSGMFYGCTFLKKINRFNIGKNAEDMFGMFMECKRLENLEFLWKWDVSNVRDFGYMFYRCQKIENLDWLGRWATRSAENMRDMFCECRSLKNINGIKSLNTRKVKNLEGFLSETAITDLNALSKFKTENVFILHEAFSGCNQLKDITGMLKWNMSKVYDSYHMLYGCPADASLLKLSNLRSDEWQ